MGYVMKVSYFDRSLNWIQTEGGHSDGAPATYIGGIPASREWSASHHLQKYPETTVARVCVELTHHSNFSVTVTRKASAEELGLLPAHVASLAGANVFLPWAKRVSVSANWENCAGWRRNPARAFVLVSPPCLSKSTCLKLVMYINTKMGIFL